MTGPFVWMPNANEPPRFDFATYGQINDQAGRYELKWFSRVGLTSDAL